MVAFRHSIKITNYKRVRIHSGDSRCIIYSQFKFVLCIGTNLKASILDWFLVSTVRLNVHCVICGKGRSNGNARKVKGQVVVDRIAIRVEEIYLHHFTIAVVFIMVSGSHKAAVIKFETAVVCGDQTPSVKVIALKVSSWRWRWRRRWRRRGRGWCRLRRWWRW